MNCPQSLPSAVLLRADVFAKVAAGGPARTPLALRQWLAFGRQLVGFYKSGVTNVYHNRKALQAVLRRMVFARVDAAGRRQSVHPTSPAQLDWYLGNQLAWTQIERETVKRDPRPPPISRADYQLVHRTHTDLPKLPLFALAALVFEETVPIVCYIAPAIMPSTCVLPVLRPRLYAGATKAQQALAADYVLRMAAGILRALLAARSAYAMLRRELVLAATATRVMSGMLPPALYPTRVLQQRLHNYTQHLIIDNRLIAANGGATALLDAELVQALGDRLMIDRRTPPQDLGPLRVQLQQLLTSSLALGSLFL